MCLVLSIFAKSINTIMFNTVLHMSIESSDLDMLKIRGVSERDLLMFKMRMEEGKKYNEIAAHFGLKNGVSASRRVKKIQALLKSIDKGVKSGDIVLKSTGVGVSAQQNSTGMQLALPSNNPFLALNTFQDLAGISSAGGAVIGAGAATLMQGFTREDLPYEERQMMALKGGAVIASSLLSLYLTFNKFTQEREKKMKTINSEGEVIDRPGRSDGQQ
jgi:hypothetical protein